jgi:hypothetical protein
MQQFKLEIKYMELIADDFVFEVSDSAKTIEFNFLRVHVEIKINKDPICFIFKIENYLMQNAFAFRKCKGLDIRLSNNEYLKLDIITKSLTATEKVLLQNNIKNKALLCLDLYLIKILKEYIKTNEEKLAFTINMVNEWQEKGINLDMVLEYHKLKNKLLEFKKIYDLIFNNNNQLDS